MSTGTTPYLGSKISLVSKAKIRYEGILYTIDTNESTVALAKVRSLGTEDRPTDRPVAPRDEIYEYIIFRGSDIEDLHVCEPYTAQKQTTTTLPSNLIQDPAIVKTSAIPTTTTTTSTTSTNVASTMNSMMNNLQSSSTATTHQKRDKVSANKQHLSPMQDSSVQVDSNMSSDKKSHKQQYNNMDDNRQRMNQQQQQQQRNNYYNQRNNNNHNDSYNNDYQNMNYRNNRNMMSNNSSYNQQMPNNNSSSRNGQFRQNGNQRNQMMNMPQRNNQHYMQKQNMKYNNNNNKSMNSSFNSQTDMYMKPSMRQQQQQQQQSSKNKNMNGLMDGFGDSFKQQHQQQQRQHKRMNSGNKQRKLSLSRENTNTQMSGQKKRQAVSPHHNQQKQRSQRRSNSTSGSDRIKVEPLKFEGEFNFEEANDRFEQEIQKEFENKLKISSSKSMHDTSSSNIMSQQDMDQAHMLMKQKVMDMDSQQQHSATLEHKPLHEMTLEETKNFYDKSSSFFDKISCEANDKIHQQLKQKNWKEERKMNAETFGMILRQHNERMNQRNNNYYRNNNNNNMYNRRSDMMNNNQRQSYRNNNMMSNNNNNNNYNKMNQRMSMPMNMNNQQQSRNNGYMQYRRPEMEVGMGQQQRTYRRYNAGSR